ncbi:flagellar basal-body rod protein FlgB [Candidatus Kryptobacter tengchongensis]|uniref:Flagellar basal body rod protein FlgB n=1 Tax=Kryptobacter tengchongensis TaxID=1643429 RepID=A0A656D3X6_KRYT1|nr:flagellar basal body rod protein FlgB [Candidatus Kryptobacter tengchongensis]CUS91264.1 flagellar basal-body rod protein FlgB [Candidatus Kryptobacter tengchongensis]CUS97546.1 flagellar basal-body rod protein FlgB [Candidatus Kryptobacter tengchongensis]CUU09661.1 flagellar basal-body rod protein FlgB [Candidatus Kryptobacter tengchongensis]
MLKIFLFNRTKIPLLEKALDAYSLRQRAIASNIANITTIGYRRVDVKFEDELQRNLGGEFIKGMRTNEKHIAIGAKDINDVQPEIARQSSDYNPDPLASGVNDVDIDQEMVELAKNQIRYRLASRLIAESFRGIQKSIKGGGV